MSPRRAAVYPGAVAELTPDQWRARARAHADRVDALVGDHLERRRRGEAHPVHDFLFTYYSLRPARLRRWQPGAGVTLVHEDGRRETLDVAGYLDRRAPTVRFVADLLAATAARPAQLGCFGLHEWAMVYRHGADGERRHPAPLRLGPAGTDAVVEGMRIRCSHFDAYRFFTPEAMPRNTLRPSREQMVTLEQPGCLHATLDMHTEPEGNSVALPLTRRTAMQHEQPGCLHANMDCYRWAYKLGEAVSSEFLVDCFELAQRIRVLDMRASPYDLSDYGFEPVQIETAEGRAEYVEHQRAFAAEGQALRRRLLEVCGSLLLAADPPVGVRKEGCVGDEYTVT